MIDLQFNISTTALLIIDLQNDFLHAKGAYQRGGVTNKDLTVLPQKIKPLADIFRNKNGWIISTQFTLIPNRDGSPFIYKHLKELRPFLSKGDFESGSWGHDLVKELKPADITIEKIAYSAFYMTKLEWILRKAGIENIFVCGIVTNGGVASTVRDSHIRDFNTFIISDCCAAHSQNIHELALTDLSTVSKLITSIELKKLLED